MNYAHIYLLLKVPHSWARKPAESVLGKPPDLKFSKYWADVHVDKI